MKSYFGDTTSTPLFDFSDIKVVTKLALPENSTKPTEVKKITEVKSGDSAAKSMALPKTANDDAYNLGSLFQGNSKPAGLKNLQAKKVDINFDADDFFSQFDPVPAAKQAPEETEKKKNESPKAAAVEEEKATDTKKQGFTMAESKPVEKEEEENVQSRYDQLVKSGATAISSDMMFGKEEDQKSKGGRWSQPETVSFGQRLSDSYQAARLTTGSK